MNPFRLMKKLFLVVTLFLLTSSVYAQPRPDAPRYAQAGPYLVGVREFLIEDESDSLPVMIWYPALNPEGVEVTTEYRAGILAMRGNALRDAEPDFSGGPYPVILFSHGSGGIRFQSTFLTEHLASYGFVVVAIDHPKNTLLDALSGALNDDALLESFATRPFEMLRLITFLDQADPFESQYELLDMSRMVVSGHSFGGYTALAVGGAQLDFSASAERCTADPEASLGCSIYPRLDEVATLRGLDEVPQGLWPATTDPRIQAVVALAPASEDLFGEIGITHLDLPTLMLTGSADAVLPVEGHFYPIYDALPHEQKASVVFENGGHYLFVTDCSYFPTLLLNMGLFSKCSDLVWDMQRAHEITNHYVTAFLLTVLYDDADAHSVFTAGSPFLGVELSQTGF